MRYRSITFFIIACLFLVFSCARNKDAVYRKSRALMDTYITISVVAGSGGKAEAAIDKAFLEIEKFGQKVDFFSEDSEISLINRDAGLREVRVSAETLDLIKRAVSAAAESGGAFDPTVGPVMKLWNFHEGIKPSDDEIRRVLPLVNYRYVRIDEEKSSVFLEKTGMMLDLGGIAKGYAADLGVAALRKEGIASGIVAVAGDIRTFGLKPDGGPWNIGLRNPRQKDESDELIGRLSLSGKAISTAGDYERFFISEGKRYHHLLDPSTGYPADCCRSVSVVSDEGVLSDAFSTAVFVLGQDRGISLLRQMDLEAILVDGEGRIVSTPGLKGKLEIEEND
jgi:thiamine biosynthesis lipoprotein